MSRSNHPPRHPDRPASTVRSARRDRVFAGSAFALAAVVVALVIGGQSNDGSTPAGQAASGRTEVAGLVVEGSSIDLGTVPLDVTVTPTWKLTNTSNAPVELGEPHASVLEGCCPGPLTLGTQVLEPGESTMLAFPLQMHAGMDGPHDFDVHVPIAGTEDYLTLKVVGLFAG